MARSKTTTASPDQSSVPEAPAAAVPEATPKATAPRAAGPKKAPVAKRVAKATKVVKPQKPKLVRDSFTIPKGEYQVLDTLKSRAIAAGQPVKKGELLRAGIQALAAMSDRAFLKAIQSVPTLKTGRPKAGESAS